MIIIKFHFVHQTMKDKIRRLNFLKKIKIINENYLFYYLKKYIKVYHNNLF
jgi:hypothetical protein